MVIGVVWVGQVEEFVGESQGVDCHILKRGPQGLLIVCVIIRRGRQEAVWAEDDVIGTPRTVKMNCLRYCDCGLPRTRIWSPRKLCLGPGSLWLNDVASLHLYQYFKSVDLEVSLC